MRQFEFGFGNLNAALVPISVSLICVGEQFVGHPHRFLTWVDRRIVGVLFLIAFVFNYRRA